MDRLGGSLLGTGSCGLLSFPANGAGCQKDAPVHTGPNTAREEPMAETQTSNRAAMGAEETGRPARATQPQASLPVRAALWIQDFVRVSALKG